MAFNVLGKVLTANTKEEKKSSSTTQNLTEQEVNFILAKLRDANYKGAEFEMFYNVWIKLAGDKVK